MSSSVDEFNMADMIGSLRMADILRPQPMRQSRPRQRERPILQSWAITRFALGCPDKDNTFSVEYSHNLGYSGKLETDPDKRKMIISGGPVEVHISDFAVRKIQILDSHPTELLFTLDHAPFFGTRERRQLSRRDSIDLEHATLGQAINRFVLVTFSSSNERHRFCDAERRRSPPKPRHANINLVRRGLYSSTQMSRINQQIKDMPGPIAFQVSPISPTLLPNDQS